MRKAMRAVAVAAAGLLFGLAGQAQPAADPRFPALGKLPPHQRQAVAGLLDWQRAFDDMPLAELQRRMGPPDKTGDMGVNPVTGKPMRSLGYRLSRRSEMQFTIHEGKVAAVTMLLLPSANEAGPAD